MLNGLGDILNFLFLMSILALCLLVLSIILFPTFMYRSWMPLHECKEQYNVHECEWVAQPIYGEEIVQ